MSNELTSYEVMSNEAKRSTARAIKNIRPEVRKL